MKPSQALRWLGGGVFVFSLAYLVWAFCMSFGRTRPFAGWPAVAADSLLFTIFAAHHSAFARENVKRALGRTIPESTFRSVYVWTASVLMVLVVAAWQLIGGVLYAVEPPAAWLLRTMQLAGVWLVARSVRAIDALELAGIRPARDPAALQDSGPYSFVRHPVYLGWLLLVFGMPTMTGDRFAFAIVSSAYILVAIPWEERSLTRAFGTRYSEYCRRVRWRVLPGVY
jgi:protein-S-isoprenylcysteine O-methyltransferase Ste14